MKKTTSMRHRFYHGLLRVLPSGVQDVDIVRPSLDAVYAAFLKDEGTS